MNPQCWQALRSVWQLGQTQPVRAAFAVYKDAKEAQVLALMGRKMRAAQTLYGDEVGGPIVSMEDGNFMTELAREVLEGAELADLQLLFSDEVQVSPSSLGCPANAIPVQVPVASQSWEEWTLMHGAGRNISLEEVADVPVVLSRVNCLYGAQRRRDNNLGPVSDCTRSGSGSKMPEPELRWDLAGFSLQR
jgi:hypothetical protein